MASFQRIFENAIADDDVSDTLLKEVSTSTSQSSSTIDDASKKFIQDDYRAFCFCIHPIHGMLLLHCTRKAQKGPHFQLPGGHVDEPEFIQAAKQTTHQVSQLYVAARAGLARELYEETGLDFRQETQLDRFKPVRLKKKEENEMDSTSNSYYHCSKDGKQTLVNEFKRRVFFLLQLNDEDFVQQSTAENPAYGPMDDASIKLKLKLSHEHQGFRFEKDPVNAIDALALHSGGKVSEALKMAL